MNILRADIRVGERYLLCRGIVGLQQIKQRQRGHPPTVYFPASWRNSRLLILPWA